MRRNDASTSFRRRVPVRFLINQCQIITFLILKYDIIENSRIELRGIVLPVQMGGLLGGPKGMLPPPLSNYWGGLAPPGPPLPTPMYNMLKLKAGWLVGWLVVLGLTAFWDSISVCIEPPAREWEKEERKIDEKKNVQTAPPAPTASAVGPCPTIIQSVGRPGTGSWPRTIAPPNHSWLKAVVHSSVHL